MIDYINALITGINISELEINSNLNFCYEVNPRTGEMRTKKRNNKNAIPFRNAYFKGLEFKIYDSGSVYVNGSLHKFWNSGGHNYNDFDLVSLHQVLAEIQQTFNIKPHQFILRQLEIGVNIIPPYATETILKHCFLHGTQLFKWVHVSDEGKYIQAVHSQYIIKIYDKARHYRNKGFTIEHPEILRFEIKYKKLEKLKKSSIYTIQDLINYGLQNFVDELVNQWRKVLFYDITIKHDSKSLLNYKNPLYWHELKCRRSAYDKHKRKYKNIVAEYSSNIALKIEDCIRDKGILLTQQGATFDQKKKQLRTPSKNIKGTTIDYLSIRSILTPPPIKYDENICQVTGLNISMQRQDSFLLSHTGLKYYYKTNRKIFNEVKRKFLSDKWIKSGNNDQIKEMAHNIRNKANNRRNKQKRIYPVNQYRLNIFWSN